MWRRSWSNTCARAERESPTFSTESRRCRDPGILHNAAAPSGADSPQTLLSYEQLRQLERDNVLAVLEKHNWNISGAGGAAEFLGVHAATLSSRLRKMGIQRPR